MKSLIILTVFSVVLSTAACASVDTLRGTAAIEDATIYGYPDCNPDVLGEDCRSYNTGGCLNLKIGSESVNDHRAVMRFIGWNGVLPDSSALELYCESESDSEDRHLFAYPLTRRFYEGSECFLGIGDRPIDSGVTWNHVWLDTSIPDSLRWSSPGGDVVTAVACTMLVTSSGSYYRFPHFNRILAYWDSTGGDCAIMLVNQNAFPANASAKTFTSTEGAPEHAPRLILYYGGDIVINSRRRIETIVGPGRP